MGELIVSQSDVTTSSKSWEGGMAVVYKAYDTHLECEVAVKVIRTDMLAPVVLERALKRFEHEAKPSQN